MRIITLFFCLLLVAHGICKAQSYDDYIVNLNGPGLLSEIHTSYHPHLTIISFHMMGNERQQKQLVKQREARDSGTDSANFAMAYHFAKGEWKKVIDIYREINTPNISDEYFYLYALLGQQSYQKVLDDVQIKRWKDRPLAKLIVAECYLGLKKYDKALHAIEALTEDGSVISELLGKLKLATLQIYTGRYEEALRLASEAQTLGRLLNDDYSIALSFYLQALANARSGSFEEAGVIAGYGSVLARRAGNYTLEYRVNNILSWAGFMTNERLDILLANEARQVWLVEKLGDLGKKASVYNNLGYDLTVSGSVPLDSCILLMTEANDIYAQAAGNEGRWYTLMNLIWQYRLKGDFETAVRYATLSLKQAEKIKDRHAIIEVAFQYGETLLAQGKVKQAEEFYNRGLKLRGEETDRDAYVFDVYYANYLWHTGAHHEAKDLLRSAISFLQNSEVFYEMHGRALLAQFYYESGQFTKASEQLLILEAPRSDYIAFETRFIAAMVKVKLLRQDGFPEKASAIGDFYRWRCKAIGAEMLLMNYQKE